MDRVSSRVGTRVAGQGAQGAVAVEMACVKKAGDDRAIAWKSLLYENFHRARSGLGVMGDESCWPWQSSLAMPAVSFSASMHHAFFRSSNC